MLLKELYTYLDHDSTFIVMGNDPNNGNIRELERYDGKESFTDKYDDCEVCEYGIRKGNNDEIIIDISYDLVAADRLKERKRLVAAMEYIIRFVNNEDFIHSWLIGGVPDGDIPFGEFDPDIVPDYLGEKVTVEEFAKLFLKIMANAEDDGGLYIR